MSKSIRGETQLGRLGRDLAQVPIFLCNLFHLGISDPASVACNLF